jgi:phosphoribosyl-AMP cyclohydrolase
MACVPEPRYNADGLVPVVAQDARDGRVLMLAWMDAEAYRRTLATRQATYWSRSRQVYWVKGETSGHRQRVREVRLDCDSDAVLLRVDQVGPACHTGAPTCFEAQPAVWSDLAAGSAEGGGQASQTAAPAVTAPAEANQPAASAQPLGHAQEA